MCASNEIVVLACAAVVLVAPGLRDCSLVPTGICNALLTSTALVLAALMQRFRTHIVFSRVWQVTMSEFRIRHLRRPFRFVCGTRSVHTTEAYVLYVISNFKVQITTCNFQVPFFSMLACSTLRTRKHTLIFLVGLSSLYPLLFHIWCFVLHVYLYTSVWVLEWLSSPRSPLF